jgi:hypothetical protein
MCAKDSDCGHDDDGAPAFCMKDPDGHAVRTCLVTSQMPAWALAARRACGKDARCRVLWIDAHGAFDAHDTATLKFRGGDEAAMPRTLIEAWRRLFGSHRLIVVRGEGARDDVVARAVAIAREAGIARVDTAHLSPKNGALVID